MRALPRSSLRVCTPSHSVTEWSRPGAVGLKGGAGSAYQSSFQLEAAEAGSRRARAKLGRCVAC